MIYLISDLHLEESRPDITGAFFYFLDQIEQDAKQLYILGDFFEAWVGDDENTPLQVKIKARLKRLTETGIETFFMAGNRDFLIGEQFSQDTGVTVLPEPSKIKFNGEDVILIHGDSLCTRDTAYMKLRTMLRAPGFIETFLARPLEDRLTTARQLREMSQASNQNKSNEIMDVTPEEVIKLMEEQRVQTLIHGHTHRPATHNLTIDAHPASRIVLGDWDKQIWFIRIDETKQSLELINQAFPENAESFA
jgi:UDP-2,3-diacylglucosamine hydrolase